MEPVDDPRLYSGRYQVTHLIARGGMAIVYRAQDTLLNRPVALKTLYPELSADPLFVERFRREAQAAANLSHPNIVPVFDWGEDNGTYFIVMELVDGTSLADMLRGGRTLTASHSATLMAQVAAALGYAHRNGVVHRDVKPGNILIASDGQVKVTDFGIAQAMSVEDLRSDLVRFSEGQPVRAAQRDVAFFGQDATRAVSKVAPGERTQAVPMMTGPRTDVRPRRNGSANVIVIVVILLLVVGGLAYFLTQKSAPPTVAMPSLIGKTENAALQKMANQGIKLNTKVVSIHSATVKAGFVISTDPKAGVTLTKGEHVILTVSHGVQAAPLLFPSLKGLTLAAATNELEIKPYFLAVKTGFLQTVPPGVTNTNPNFVVSQVPAAGTKGHQGDTITIYVLSPNAQYQVCLLY